MFFQMTDGCAGGVPGVCTKGREEGREGREGGGGMRRMSEVL
jgi:hypothetical protein